MTHRSGRESRFLIAAWLCLGLGCAERPTVPDEVVGFAAEEARQAVAVAADAVFAIGNRSIAKYDRSGERKLAAWEGPEDGPIQHLNSGVVVGGRLYCAHSNYPALPMTSSVEIWEVDSLSHVGSHSFGIAGGSLTWVDRYEGSWWAGFAQYSGARAEPGRDPSWSSVVQLDSEWRRLQGWVFPASVLERFEPMSNSGASWGRDGFLYATGHDRHEVYVLKLPDAGSTLEHVATVPVASFGQGIAWARQPGRERELWGIVKAERRVVATQVAAVPQPR